MKTEKVVIERVPSYRYRGIGSAAKKLGVSPMTVRIFLGGRTGSLSAAKRERIVVKTITK